MIIEEEKRSAALPVKPPVRKQFSDIAPVESLKREPSLVPPPEPQQSSAIETQPKEEIQLQSFEYPNENPTEIKKVEEQAQPELLDQIEAVSDHSIPTPQTPPQRIETDVSIAVSEKESLENIQDLVLTESLSVPDITRLLSIICNYIENLEEPLIVKKSYYAASNPSSSSNLTKKKIDIAIDAASLDELNNENSEDLPPEVLSWIVLKFAEEKGSYLLPR